MSDPLTQGIHHLGLTVSRLEESAAFFTSVLGWQEVKRRNDYPAIFVSDGKIMLTLWACQGEPVSFDKSQHVGLHHVALTVSSLERLQALHATLQQAGVPIEFAPELLGSGPARHMMCYEPSGIRIEFIWPGQ